VSRTRRTLTWLLPALVLACLIGLLFVPIQRALFIRHIERAGGEVYRTPPTWMPEWGSDLLDDHFPFGSDALSLVDGLEFFCPQSRGDVRRLSLFASSLEVLALEQCRIDASDLEGLPEFPWLQDVWMDRSDVDDATLGFLVERCPQLHTLSLTGSKLTDAGLTSLPDLSGLYLAETPTISSAGLSHLPSSLTTLNIQGTAVDDTAIPFLSGLTNLVNLMTGGSGLTAEGRAELKRVLPKLEHLD